MKKNISSHVTSLLSAAGAIVTLVHPGFTVPPFVQGLTVSVCVFVAMVMQVLHVRFSQQLQVAEKMASSAAAFAQAATDQPVA
jgi:type IV secretory pathway VirB3-like protein